LFNKLFHFVYQVLNTLEGDFHHTFVIYGNLLLQVCSSYCHVLILTKKLTFVSFHSTFHLRR
jgi:hypothetical protein